MSPLGLVTLGFAPGLFWLWRIYRRNTYRPDPKGLVLRTFLLGVVAAVPIVGVELAVSGQHGASPAYEAFVVAALVEEVGKFLVVRRSIYESPYFTDQMSGLVYAAAAALGFASIENVGYMARFGAFVIIPRAALATLGHVTFSAAWGYALGTAKRARSAAAPVAVVIGLTVAIVLHGAYDVSLMTGSRGSALGVFVLGGALFLALLGSASSGSVHRDAVARAIARCPTCGASNPSLARFCVKCRSAFSVARTTNCGGCSATLVEGASFCSSCGSRIVRDPDSA